MSQAITDLECKWFEEAIDGKCIPFSRKKIRLWISILLILYLMITVSITIFSPLTTHVLDTDRTSRNTTFIALSPFNQIAAHPFMPIDWDPDYNHVLEVSDTGDIVWEFQNTSFCHEIVELPNNHVLLVRTGFDDIIEIDYPNHNIVWQWRVADMNWSAVNASWGPDHYYNTPRERDWAHINDVDFKQYPTWNACLISIRNFDLILELNYSAALTDPYNPANIVWTYGEHGNYTLLRHQHNPEYMANGNILVADSRNTRIVEINYTTREQVWSYSNGLQWCRDVDEMMDGNLLVTDSNEVLILNKTTSTVVWRYFWDMAVPYEADELSNGNILIAGGLGGFVIEIDPDTNRIVWQYEKPSLRPFVIGLLLLIFLLTFGSFILGNRRKRDIAYFSIVTFILGLVWIFYAQLMSLLMYTIIQAGAG